MCRSPQSPVLQMVLELGGLLPAPARCSEAFRIRSEKRYTNSDGKARNSRIGPHYFEAQDVDS